MKLLHQSSKYDRCSLQRHLVLDPALALRKGNQGPPEDLPLHKDLAALIALPLL